MIKYKLTDSKKEKKEKEKEKKKEEKEKLFNNCDFHCFGFG